MSYEVAKTAVTDMLSGLEKQNESPHYSLAYLESMLTSWATIHPTVLEEVNRTNNWLKEEASKNA
jgi:hypothetical protein